MNKLTQKQWIVVTVSLLTLVLIMVLSFKLSTQSINPNMNTSSNTGPKEEKTKFANKILKEGVAEADTLQTEDLIMGQGGEALANSTVVVNYEGYLVDGTKFDSSFDRGIPFEFILGEGSVIQGWEQGIPGMKEGGVRTIVIPPALAYGSTQYGPIPANSTLVFIVELVQIK